MQVGELTETVRNRSVYRQFHLDTAGGRKCCRGNLSGLIFSTAGPLPGYGDMPWRQVTAAANSLASDGAEGAAVSIQGCLPTTYEETRLREDMRQFAIEIKASGMEAGEVNIEVSAQVKAAQYFVTAVGYRLWATAQEETGREWESTGMESDDLQNLANSGTGAGRWERGLRPGGELVVTRQIALSGTAALARAYENELCGRFPFWLVDQAKDFDRFMSVAETARAAYQFGADTVYDVAQGGIFNALWELAEQAGVGLDVDLRRIPVNQETIEICEYFDLNPYYLYSAGCLLIGTEHAEALVGALHETGVPAAVIGRTTNQNERILWNGENRRFLERPKQDELWKLADGIAGEGQAGRLRE
ncbi:MAG: hypothetical protein LIP11_01105 [Clostridiales bacterium]|nr:hypothetical protein [Clostridiales bacterium]